MLWDCSSCGTRKLLGKSHRRCPHCGAAQDARKRYFPPPGEEVAVEGHVFVGIDWSCGACHTPNSRAAEFCVNCGTPREGNAAVATVADDLGGAAGAASAEAPPQVPIPFRFAAEDNEVADTARASEKALGFRANRRVAGLSGLVLAFIATLFSWTKNVDVVIESHEWTREIDIERMAARSDSAWCDSMPGDAYDVSRSREERSQRQIADGEECSDSRVDNGDGTFSTNRSCSTTYRSEPVYDDRCRFTVDRWGTERTAKNAGKKLFPEPSWPAVQVRGGNCLGCEREGSRREILAVVMRGRADRGKTWRCVIDDARWRALGDGEWRQIEVRVLTGGAVCDTLKP